jgi:hypothetical protein
MVIKLLCLDVDLRVVHDQILLSIRELLFASSPRGAPFLTRGWLCHVSAAVCYGKSVVSMYITNYYLCIMYVVYTRLSFCPGSVHKIMPCHY